MNSPCLTTALACAMALSGCSWTSSTTGRMGPTYEEAAVNKFVGVNQGAINRLVAGLDLALLAGAPVLVATVVNINDLRRSAPLGRTLSEQYASFMVANGFNVKELKLRGDVFAQTKTFFSSNSGSITPRTQLPGYSTVDVRLSWNEIMRSQVSLAAYAKNVFDKFYYQSGYVEGASGGFNTAIPGEPQTFGAELSVKF